METAKTFNYNAVKINTAQLIQLAQYFGFEPALISGFCKVEGGDYGFSPVTGKLIIQFEPAWFKRLFKDWKEHADNSVWLNNGVGNQSTEWLAFNDAYSENPDKAMQSTSAGVMQLMGFHYAEAGFKNVGAMWDSFKLNEYNQVRGTLSWIKTQPKLVAAMKNLDYDGIATYYNGAGYKELAAKYNTTPYDIRIKTARQLFL